MTGAYKSKLGGRAQTPMVSDVMSVFSVPVPGPGSCFQCSTLTDKTGLCQVRYRFRTGLNGIDGFKSAKCVLI